MRANGFVNSLAAAMAVVAATITGMPAAEAGKCCAWCNYSSCCVQGSGPRCACSAGHSYCWFALTDQPTQLEIYASEEQLAALEEHILRAYDLGLVSVGDATSMIAEGIVVGNAELYDEGMEAYLDALGSLSEEERDRL